MSRIKIVAIVLIAAGVLGLIYGPQDRLARGIGEGQGNRQHTDLVRRRSDRGRDHPARGAPAERLRRSLGRHDRPFGACDYRVYR